MDGKTPLLLAMLDPSGHVGRKLQRKYPKQGADEVKIPTQKDNTGQYDRCEEVTQNKIEPGDVLGILALHVNGLPQTALQQEKLPGRKPPARQQAQEVWPWLSKGPGKRDDAQTQNSKKSHDNSQRDKEIPGCFSILIIHAISFISRHSQTLP